MRQRDFQTRLHRCAYHALTEMNHAFFCGWLLAGMRVLRACSVTYSPSPARSNVRPFPPGGRSRLVAANGPLRTIVV